MFNNIIQFQPYLDRKMNNRSKHISDAVRGFCRLMIGKNPQAFKISRKGDILILNVTDTDSDRFEFWRRLKPHELEQFGQFRPVEIFLRLCGNFSLNRWHNAARTGLPRRRTGG